MTTNPFSSWTAEDARRHNERVLRGKSEPGGTCTEPKGLPVVHRPAQRIRQGEPTMNKLEQQWAAVLTADEFHWRFGAMRFRLANGAWYKPDFTSVPNRWDDFHSLYAWEVKGPKQARWSRRGELTIKVAATLYAEIRFVLVWKENGQWIEQVVEP